MEKSFSLILIFLIAASVSLAFMYSQETANTQNTDYGCANGDCGDFAFQMTAEDCFPWEDFDPIEKACFVEFDCETEDQCNQLEQEYQTKVDKFANQSYDEGKDVFDDLGGQRQNPGEYDMPAEEGYDIVSYSVNGNLIENPVFYNQSEEYQNQSRYQEIWKYALRVIPGSKLGILKSFEVFTDGEGGMLAAVSQAENDPEKWILTVDIADAYNGSALNREDMAYSMIHEFGHLLTLGPSQVTADAELLNATDSEFDSIYSQKKAECKTFFTGEGCSLPNSYINIFYQRFWEGIYPEFEGIKNISNDETYYQESEKFYNRYSSWFVTEYASTNPGEDIAESWTAFILKDKPADTTIAEEKVLFFYEFPELVDMRDLIRSRLGK